MHDKRDNRSGVILLVVICFILALINILALGYLKSSGSQARVATKQLDLEKAQYVAEAGAESAVASVMNAGSAVYAVMYGGATTTSITGSIGGGTFAVTIVKTAP